MWIGNPDKEGFRFLVRQCFDLVGIQFLFCANLEWMTVKALFVLVLVLVFSTVRTALRQTKIKTKNLRLGILSDCPILKLKPY